jgi:multisubunit Na+/H+ antiporter MnhF subunit
LACALYWYIVIRGRGTNDRAVGLKTQN